MNHYHFWTLKCLCLGFKGFFWWMCLIFGFQLWSNTPWRWSHYFYQIFSQGKVLSEKKKKGNYGNRLFLKCFWLLWILHKSEKGLIFERKKKIAVNIQYIPYTYTIYITLLCPFFLTKWRLSRGCRLTLRNFNTCLPSVIAKINHLSMYFEKKQVSLLFHWISHY